MPIVNIGGSAIIGIIFGGLFLKAVDLERDRGKLLDHELGMVLLLLGIVTMLGMSDIFAAMVFGFIVGKYIPKDTEPVPALRLAADGGVADVDTNQYNVPELLSVVTVLNCIVSLSLPDALPILLFIAPTCVLHAATGNKSQVEFPGRSLYPEVNVLDLHTLKERLNDVVVVDVRSAYEYQTLRITNAVNFPVSNELFVSNIAKLRATIDKDIVFYCNGKTCMKSYKAAQSCISANIKNIFAYDAGIMDWAKAYPKHAILLNNTLNDPALLITKRHFKKHLLEPDAFADKIVNGKTIVLDVRDRFQRDALALFPGRERRAYLDQSKKLNRYIKKAKQQGRALLIYDAAGKQVRWLQYYLEYKNVPSYYFMSGGARAFYKQMTDNFLTKP